MWYVQMAGKNFRRVKKSKSYFYLKLPKKLFSRQNNICPPTKKKCLGGSKKLKSYFYLKLPKIEPDFENYFYFFLNNFFIISIIFYP